MDIQKLAGFLSVNGENFRKKLKGENSFCNGIKWNKIFKNKLNLGGERLTHYKLQTMMKEIKEKPGGWKCILCPKIGIFSVIEAFLRPKTNYKQYNLCENAYRNRETS